MSSSSPQPNGLPLAADSSSSIDESPVFKNLSPLKPEKAGPYIPRFTNTNFRSPLQVFTSPRLDPQHETRFRDVNLTAGSNDPGHYESQVNVAQIPNLEKETQSCSPSGHVQEHVAHPVGLVSKHSTKLRLQSANDATCSLGGIAELQDTTRQPDDGDTGTRELSHLTSSKQTEEAQPLSSLKLDETTGDQRTNERFDEFPEFNSKDMDNVQSTMSIHPVSGEQSVAVGNRGGGYDKQDYICQSSSEFNQNVEASEDHNMSSRSVSNRDAMDTNQNHHVIHRHLQFETTNSKNITRYYSQSFDNLTFGVAKSRLPGSINSQIFSDAKQKEICTSGQTVSYGKPITCHSHSCPSEMVKSIPNDVNSSMSALPISGGGLHLDKTGRSVSLGSNLNISGLMSKQVPQWRHDLAKNSDSSSPSLGVAERFSAQVCGDQAENHTTVAAASVSFQSTKTMKPSNDSLHLLQVEQHPASCQESMSVLQNTNRFEELNQVSPKRKRKKATTTSESHDGCKRCNCKRSKCLKLYCECFAAGIYCVDSCACINCFNKPEYEDTVFDARQQIESRNPHAFAPKVVKQSMDSPTDMDMDEDGNWATPASARHKRGCNCKKSKCLKKYCECYQSKVGCSDGCRCDNCQNSFGAKKDTVYIRVKRWKNEPHEKLNTGQMWTDSITKAAGGEQLSSTWEELDPTSNLTPLVHPCSESVVYADSSNLWDYTQVSQSQLHPGSRLLADGSFNWQYPPGFSTQQLYSQALHYLGNDYPPYQDTMKGGNTHQILTDVSTPTKVAKASSPNKKQASPPNFQSEGPCSSSLQSLRSGDKFFLHGGVSSFPPHNPYSPFTNGSNGNESYDNVSTNDQ